MSQPGSKLAGVRYKRALASSMVLIWHVIAEAKHYFWIEKPMLCWSSRRSQAAPA